MGSVIRRLRFLRPELSPDEFRLGGACPSGIESLVDPAEYGLLGVFPLISKPAEALSLFVTRRLEVLFDAAYGVHDGGAVLASVHKKGLGSGSEAHRLFIQTYGIEVGAEEEDSEMVEGQSYVPASGNKLGGEPDLFRGVENWEGELFRLRKEGFEHYLQLDVPREGDSTLDEEWPFPNGMFHLYVRPASSRLDTRWFWEF